MFLLDFKSFSRKLAFLIVVGTVATVPLLFGAVHPLVQGLYTILILIGPVAWFLLRKIRKRDFSYSPQLLLLFLFLFWIVVSVTPLPLSLLEVFSKTRAESLFTVEELLSITQQSGTFSYFAMSSLIGGCYIFVLGLYFFSICDLCLLNKNFKKTILVIIICVGVVEAFYGLMQLFNSDLGVLWLSGKNAPGAGSARGTIIYKNQYAALLNMCWPMAFALGALYRKAGELQTKKKVFKTPLRRKKIRRKIWEKIKRSTPIIFDSIFQKSALPFWAAMLMMLAVLGSRSRGGILSMMAIGFVMFVVFPYTRRQKIIMASIVTSCLVIYSSLLGVTGVVDRFSRLFIEGNVRWKAWLGSLPMLQDHWLTGSGLDTYRYLSPVYLTGGLNTGGLWDRAHNEYLESSIELGVPVFLLVLLWLAWNWYKYCKILLRDRVEKHIKPENKIIALASLVALSGFLMHGTVDFAWRLPANSIYFVTLLAILSSSLNTSHRSHKKVIRHA